jgi:hypothetical protein
MLIILHALYAYSCATFVCKHILIHLNRCRDARLNFPDLGDAEGGEEDTLEEAASGTQETGKPRSLSSLC